MSKFVKPALHPQIRKPVLTVCSSTSHCPQQPVINFYDLLDSLRCNPITSRCPRICTNDDSTLKPEGESCGTVCELDRNLAICIIIGHAPEPRGRLDKVSKSYFWMSGNMCRYFCNGRHCELQVQGIVVKKLVLVF